MFWLAATGVVQHWWGTQVVSLALASDSQSNTSHLSRVWLSIASCLFHHLPHCLSLLGPSAQTMWSASHTNPRGEELLVTGEATIDSGFVCLPLSSHLINAGFLA